MPDGSAMPSLMIERRHRYRDLSQQSSFGPGVFCNYDTKLTFHPQSDGSILIELFDPRENWPKWFKDGINDNPIEGIDYDEYYRDGIYHDGIYHGDGIKNTVKDLRLYKSDGTTLAKNTGEAKTAVLTNYLGIKYYFEIIDLSPSSYNTAAGDADTALIGRWAFEEGTGTTTSSSKDANHNGTLIGSVSWSDTARLGSHSLHFDGSAGYVGLGTPADLNIQGSITISAWLKKPISGYIAAHGNYSNLPIGASLYIYNASDYASGSNNGNLHWIYSGIPNEDLLGNWIHIAGVYDSSQNKWFLYRNGESTVPAGVTDNIGALLTPNSWAIGAMGDGIDNFMGDIDDVRIYNRALSASEIQALGQPQQFAGRLIKIEDPNGHAVTITYKTNWTEEQLQQFPDRLWQIDSVTDSLGRTATFYYSQDQVGGRWVVDHIELPDGRKVVYSYGGGTNPTNYLTKVEHQNNSGSTTYSTSTLTFVDDTLNTQCTKVIFDDPIAGGTHRTKTVYLSSNFHLYSRDDMPELTQLYNQPSLIARMTLNGNGEVSYLNSPGNDWSQIFYEGANKLKKISNYGRNISFYKDNWTISVQSSVASVTGTEDTSASISCTKQEGWSRTPSAIYDVHGNSYNYQYNDDTFPLSKTYIGSLGTEKWAYGDYFDATTQRFNGKRVIAYKDRDDRVTKYTYDNNGNITYMEVGMICSSPNDPDWQSYCVSQPEYAKYRWDYYGDSVQVDGVMQPKGQLQYEYAPDSSNPQIITREYVYNSSGLIWKVNEVNDNDATRHLAYEYFYDGSNANRLNQVKQYIDSGFRSTWYEYDALSRVKKITYADNSTEEFLYGTYNTDPNKNQPDKLLARKDRNGSVTIYRYDASGRQTELSAAVANVGSTGSILSWNWDSIPAPAGYLAEASVTAYTYLDGTNLQETITTQGKKTSYIYDYRQRIVQTKVYPRRDPGEQDGLKVLVTSNTYINNLLDSTEDPYGRKTFYTYRSGDSALYSIMQATRPLVGSEYPYRDFWSPNSFCLVTDYTLNNSGQVIATIDPRYIKHSTVYDSRGRATDRFDYDDYSGTNVVAHSQTIYDADSNVVEVRSPRYFESGNSGEGKCNETWTYTNRNLPLTHTVAAGADDYLPPSDQNWTPNKVRVTESWTYNLDRTQASHTDFRNNIWYNMYSPCCAGRIIEKGRVDNLTELLFLEDYFSTRYDHFGNVTVSMQQANTPSTGTIYRQTTTRYDARHRPKARTVWMTTQSISSEQEQNPPICGGGEQGDPPASSNAMTTRWYYDDDLTDTSGLNAGITVTKMLGGTMTINITPLLNELKNDINGGNAVFGADSTGSAVVTVNPQDEISAAIMDSTGRTVATGIFSKVDGTLITWKSVKYDEIVSINVFGDGSGGTVAGNVVQTTQIDALNHATKSLNDGAGRSLQTIDALSNVTNYKYDANSNLLSVRDPNGVGWDAASSLNPTTYDGYDALNQLVSRTDTQNDKTKKYYDHSGNVTKMVDAKNYGSEIATTQIAYDARNRKIQTTDRQIGVTTWKYDQNSNLLEMCDPDNQTTAKPTIWTYNARNQKLTEAYPGHNPSSNFGDPDYDKILFSYDEIGRLKITTTQRGGFFGGQYKGDTITLVYDKANQIKQREFRQYNSQSPIRIEMFNYDKAGRMTTANSGTTNILFNYSDGAGRVTHETLSISGVSLTVQSHYDAAGQRDQITYPDGSVVLLDHYESGQLQQIRYNGAMLASYEYDIGGRRITRTLGDTPGTETTWTYGRQDNLVTSISSNIVSFTYDYDANKNKLKETLGAPMANYGFGTTNQAVYDAEDQLTDWQRDDGNLHQQWALTPAGDWNPFTTNSVPQGRAHDPVHQFTQVNPPTGPLMDYDAKGNLTVDRSRTPNATYAWDLTNHLTTGNYVYDALGRRVAKQIAWGPQAIRFYVQDGQQEIAEYEAYYDEENNLVSCNVQCKYVYADYIDEPVARIVGTDKRYYHQNNIYSTAALTSQAGAVLERFSYDAYGKPTFHWANGTPRSPQPTESVTGNPYLFTGRRWDGDTALYYYRARMYDPRLGRFLSRDPIDYDSGDENIYRYVHNNPIMHLDPSGLVNIDEWPSPIRTDNICSKEDMNSVKESLKEVCDFVNSSDGEKCMGPNLRKCVQSLCAGKIMVKCLKKCVDWNLCAAAEVYDIDGKRNSPVTEKYLHSKPCSPFVPLSPSHRLGILVCLTKVGGNPGYPNGCGSSAKATLLHELTHFCGQQHAYDKGQGQPEACERSCFSKDIDPNYWRFQKTPDKCKCECTSASN